MGAVTATDLPRLLTCNGSRLMGGFTPPVKPNKDRDEGIAAHWLVEQVHAGNFSAEELIDRKAPNGVYITVQMVDYLEDYLKFLPNSWIEHNTSFTVGQEDHVYEINGRTDMVRYGQTTQRLQICDLKYGWGIVEPTHNWTMISHAIGFMLSNPHLPVQTIQFMIFQPRPYHHEGPIRTWTITAAELDALHVDMATKLLNLNEVLNTSEHCKHCPAVTVCPAYRNARMNAIDTSEKAFTDEIDNDRLSFELDQLKRAIDVLKQAEKAYKELATHRSKKGEIIKNYGVTKDLANRQWYEHLTPEMVEAMTGTNVTEKKLISPAQAERAGISKEVVDSLCERREKGVKLVRMDANTKAKKLFDK